MYRVHPKKNLGQHFLIDLSIAQRIADTVDVCPDLPILEVGPGMGALSQYLLPKRRLLKVVEIDTESINYLRETFPMLRNYIVEGDFLKMRLNEIFDGKPFVLTGNYPYNISSQIFFKMLDYRDIIPCCTGMLQKEVAERMQAGPGTKDYGALSLAVQYYAEAYIAAYVPPNCFMPRPNVGSAVIRLTCYENAPVQVKDEHLMFRLIRASFNQRRKTLANGLTNSAEVPFGKEAIQQAIEKMGWNPSVRGEALTLAQFAALSDTLSEMQG